MTLSIIIQWLLLFSLTSLIVTSLIFIRNRVELTPIANENLPADANKDHTPKISVCIPARNEENNIGFLLESLVTQNYQSYEVLILDDQSDDQTHEIVEKYVKQDPDLFKLYRGIDKPEEWLGKPWACQQLGNLADGQILLFLDADTVLKKHTLSSISAAFYNHRIQMLSVWPQQKTVTFWEKVIIPLVYYALVSLLPSIYVYRKPRWMPKPIHHRFKTAFAASCGQCIAILNDAYREINGHKSVKNQIVEDVELAKVVKRHGYQLRMFHGIDSIFCRMYHNETEIFEGFRKNFFPGFKNSYTLFLTAALLHLIIFVVPFISLIYSFFVGNSLLLFLSMASVGIILMHRLILAVWFKWDPIYAFTHPLGVLWFQKLALYSLSDHFSGKKKKWKGRVI